jgi:hypothetical protein
VTYELDENTVVGFDTTPVEGWHEVGADEVIARIDEALAPLVAGAGLIVDKIRAMAPGQIVVKFGVKVSGTAHWVIAKAATEGNFEVTLTWKGNHGDDAGVS